MSDKEKTFIGDKEVKETTHNDNGWITIHFKDKGSDPLEMKQELFELISRPVANEGSITDVVSHCLASKYLAELSDYGLEFYMVDHISQSMRTLAHNLREGAIGRAFSSTGALDMKLNKLID